MNLIEAVQIGKDKVRLKHLQFAEDTLIFVPRRSDVVTNYCRIIDVFVVMSGLKLNYSKSSIITWNSDDHEWACELARMSSFLHAKCLITYLGIPIGDNMKRCAAWKPMLIKI